MTNAAVVSRARVLVVEDDDTARATYECTLRSAGHDVVAVATVEEANRSVHDHRPDLIVIGSRLRESAIDVLGRWRRTPRMKNVPVLFVAASSSNDQQRGSTKGANACSADFLASCVARVLRRREGTRTTMLDRAAPRAPLTLVFPSSEEEQYPPLFEHEGTRHARCRCCLRGSPPLGARVREAAERLIALGWAARDAGWDCPVCIERAKSMHPKRPILRSRGGTRPFESVSARPARPARGR